MKKSSKYIWLILLIVLFGLSYIVFSNFKPQQNLSYCESEGYPIFFTNDEVVCSKEEAIFSKDFVETSKIPGEIEIMTPEANKRIESPLEISGETLGWTFEATTSAYLTDADMNIISSAVVRAEDWTSGEITPFSGSLMFNIPNGEVDGWLIIEQANPSSLAENDNAIGIPVLFR